MEAEVANLRRAAIDLSRRRAEIEEVRQKFRRTGYDHPQSTFENDGDIGAFSAVYSRALFAAACSGIFCDKATEHAPVAAVPISAGLTFLSRFRLPLAGRPMREAANGAIRPHAAAGRPSGQDPSDSDSFSTGGAF